MSFKGFFLSLTIVAILLFSAFGTTTVYADEGTTTESTETGTPPAEESVTPEVDVPEGTPQPEEDVAVEETQQPEEEVVVEGSPQPEEDVAVEDSPEPILEQLPDNTTVTVINSEGEVEPLATQESADAIESAYDPIWCPAGQSPTPGENGCTESFSSFDELLTFLEANETDTAYQQAGTIYIQQGEYLGGESSVDFNNYNFNNFNNYDLTLQGGWDTVDNSVDPADITEFVNVPLTIGSSTNPWVGSLTLNNIWITGVTGDTGLTLYTEGNITLSGIEVTESQTGAELTADGNVAITNSSFNNNKKTGAVIKAGGNVDVYNSEFNNNSSLFYDGAGLDVESGGNVSLTQVLASYNEQFGANVAAEGSVTVVNSVFNGNVSYSYYCKTKIANGGYGLQVVTSSAPITLTGVTANENYLFGASLSGPGVNVFDSFFNKNGATSKGVAVGKGLEIDSDTYVTLINVEANGNQLFGADIQASDDVVINNSFFDGNKSYTYSCKGKTYYGYGLQVVTSEGIYLTDVSASGNNLFGASLDGSVVNIFGGFFNDNGADAGKVLTGFGIEIISDTDVSIFDIEANNNELFGANIQATDDVTISGGFFNGNKVVYTYSCKGKSSTAGGYGLEIITGGDITLDEIEASDNYTFGAHLVGGDVTIATGFFNNNGSGSLQNGTGKGLDIESTDDVSLVSIEANNNQLFGANIQAVGSVAITDGFFNGNQAYTYSCKNKAYNGYGLQIITSDDVSLVNISAEENYLFGAHIEGADIFISYGSFSNNGTGNLSDHVGYGLEIESTGSDQVVSLYEVNASNNQLFGANIIADGFVSVSSSVFSGNMSYTSNWCKGKTYDGYGLQVVTTSGINLSLVEASGNHLFGASLFGSTVNVADSSFNNNTSGSDKNPTGKGLEIESTGDVTLTYVEANNNQLFGADIESDGNVSVLGSVFNGNQYYTYSCKGNNTEGYGLKVVAAGDIVLGFVPGDEGYGVQANDNGAEGAILDGESTVTVTDSSFINNGASGLVVTADGDVTLNNVTASGNEGNGVDVTGVCTNTVNVNGGTFTDNGQYGLKVLDANLNQDGTQTFSNNSSGNVFHNTDNCDDTEEDEEETNTGNGWGWGGWGNWGWGWWGWWGWGN